MLIIYVVFLFFTQLLYGAAPESISDQIYNFQIPDGKHITSYDCYQNALMFLPKKSFGAKYLAVIDKEKMKCFPQKEKGLYALTQFLDKELAEYPVFGRFFQIDAQNISGKAPRKNRYGWCGLSNELLLLIEAFYTAQRQLSAECKMSFVGVGSGHAFLEKLFSFIGTTTAHDVDTEEFRTVDNTFMEVKIFPEPKNHENAKRLFIDGRSYENTVLIFSYPREFAAEYIEQFIKNQGKIIVFMHEIMSPIFESAHINSSRLEKILNEWTHYHAVMNTPTGTVAALYIKNRDSILNQVLEDLWGKLGWTDLYNNAMQEFNDAKEEHDECFISIKLNSFSLEQPRVPEENRKFLEDLLVKGINPSERVPDGHSLLTSLAIGNTGRTIFVPWLLKYPNIPTTVDEYSLVQIAEFSKNELMLTILYHKQKIDNYRIMEEEFLLLMRQMNETFTFVVTQSLHFIVKFLYFFANIMTRFVNF